MKVGCRFATVNVTDIELPPCVESPAYDAVSMALPVVVAVKSEGHVPRFWKLVRVQLGAVPVTPETEKVTVPDGRVPPIPVSITLTPQCAAWPVAIVAG